MSGMFANLGSGNGIIGLNSQRKYATVVSFNETSRMCKLLTCTLILTSLPYLNIVMIYVVIVEGF